ncbi:MAG TPA: hypothetical protein VN809_03765, partial [Telmatospirillum sp.]|nr:hypothetical protein [Telmatospirillum sp.]
MAPRFVCHGCGAVVDAARQLPFRCPQAGGADDDVDHLLVPDAPIFYSSPPDLIRGSTWMAGSSPAMTEKNEFVSSSEDDPFLRYRALLSPYRLARAWGLSDAAWVDIVGMLDRALVAVEGHGFRLTPMAQQPALARAAGHHAPLWVKDETGNVGGSHKARHLMGVLLYLKVLAAAGKPAGDGLTARRLAIAS